MGKRMEANRTWNKIKGVMIYVCVTGIAWSIMYGVTHS